MDVCLRVVKESNKSRFDSYSVRNRSYPTLPFGIVACTFFPTTFLEIAVYSSLHVPLSVLPVDEMSTYNQENETSGRGA